MASLGESATTTKRRDRTRHRVQLYRQRRAAEKEIARIAEAERQRIKADEDERRAEELAPGVLRKPIIANGYMLVGPRIRVINGRAERGPDFAFAPHRCRKAARQLQLDWQDVGSGLTSGAADYLRSGRGDGDGVHIAMRAQIDARARLDGAMAWLGAFAPMIARVVLDCVPIPVWAVETDLMPEGAVAHVVAGLNRLADFYRPAIKPHEIRVIPVLGPSREAYHVAGEFIGEDFDERGRLISA